MIVDRKFLRCPNTKRACKQYARVLFQRLVESQLIARDPQKGQLELCAKELVKLRSHTSDRLDGEFPGHQQVAYQDRELIRQRA